MYVILSHHTKLSDHFLVWCTQERERRKRYRIRNVPKFDKKNSVLFLLQNFKYEFQFFNVFLQEPMLYSMVERRVRVRVAIYLNLMCSTFARFNTWYMSYYRNFYMISLNTLRQCVNYNSIASKWKTHEWYRHTAKYIYLYSIMYIL